MEKKGTIERKRVGWPDVPDDVLGSFDRTMDFLFRGFAPVARDINESAGGRSHD